MRLPSIVTAALVLVACGSEDEGPCAVHAPDGTCLMRGEPPDPPAPERTAEKVCAGYLREIVGVAPGVFTPGSTSCDPGSLSDDGLADALEAANYVRWVVGLKPLEMDRSLNARSQACAAMMSNAGSLSHHPDTSWPCYTEAGAAAAAESNLGLGSAGRGVGRAVEDFFRDPGENNLRHVGHRRWLLSATPRAVGFGYHESMSNRSAVAFNVSGSDTVTSAEPRDHVAYPEGIFPYELLTHPNFLIPWSVSFPSSGIMGDVTVTMVNADDGTDVPIQGAWGNAEAFGDDHVVIFLLESAPPPGRYRYTVEIVGRQPLTIETEIVRCDS